MGDGQRSMNRTTSLQASNGLPDGITIREFIGIDSKRITPALVHCSTYKDREQAPENQSRFIICNSFQTQDKAHSAVNYTADGAFSTQELQFRILQFVLLSLVRQEPLTSPVQVQEAVISELCGPHRSRRFHSRQ